MRAIATTNSGPLSSSTRLNSESLRSAARVPRATAITALCGRGSWP